MTSVNTNRICFVLRVYVGEDTLMCASLLTIHKYIEDFCPKPYYSSSIQNSL